MIELEDFILALFVYRGAFSLFEEILNPACITINFFRTTTFVVLPYVG
jgi:hypothetical protein